MRDHTRGQHRDGTVTHRDRGYTLIEMVLVVLIVGILASVAVVAVSGVRAQAVEHGCAADARRLAVAVEAYLAGELGDQLRATGTDHDRFERTLVQNGFLRSPSTLYDLDAVGGIITQGDSTC